MFRHGYRCALRTLVVVFAALPSSVSAEPVLFTGTGTNTYDSQHHSLDASALFETYTVASTTYLKITLTNTNTSDYDFDKSKTVPSDVLTGLLFDVVGNTSLTLDTAWVFAPNKILNPDTGAGNAEAPPTGSVIGGWQYKRAASGTLTGVTQHQGLGTAGLDIFKGSEVGDVNYGIVNAAYQDGEGNTGVSNGRVIRNAVVFTLTGISSLFNPKASISNVRFQYGTAITEPHLDGHDKPIESTPEPNTLVLSSLALVGLVVWGRRRKRFAAGPI